MRLLFPFLLILAFPMSLNGCAYYDPTCDAEIDPDEADYEFCCCELEQVVYTKYGGGNCTALADCHNAGYYFPGLGDYATPDYSDMSVDWIACPDGLSDTQYDDTCEGGEGVGATVCAENLIGVWASTLEVDIVSDATADGITCSTDVANGFTFFFGFPGTGDAGNALGIFSANGDIISSNGVTAAYEDVLSPTDGYRFAVASATDNGWTSIEIHSDAPSADGTCEDVLLAVAWAYIDPVVPDTMYVDFSRDPAYDGYSGTLACNPLGLNDLVFTRLDPTDPDAVDVLDAVETEWDAASLACNGEVFTECDDESAEAAAMLPPPPSNPEELVDRIPPISGSFPEAGHYSRAFMDMAANAWTSTYVTDPTAWRIAARTKYNTVFTIVEGVTEITNDMSELLGTSLPTQTDWEEVHKRGLIFIEQLTVDPMRRAALKIVVDEYLQSNRGPDARALLDWRAFQIFLSMPQPSAPPTGMPPAPPADPPAGN